MTNIYQTDLERHAANFVALSPVSFVERSAEVFGDLPAVIHGVRRYDWKQLRERSARPPGRFCQVSRQPTRCSGSSPSMKRQPLWFSRILA